MRLRLASYNIRRGGGPRRRLLGRVLADLDPDVILLQEATDPAVVVALAGLTGTEVVVAAPGRSVAVLSRLERTSVRWHAIGPRRHVVDVELAGGLRVIGVHLSAGLSRRGEARREGEAAALLAIDGLLDPTRPVIIAGDLNSVAPGEVPAVRELPRWIRLLLRVDGGIRTVVVERLLAAGFVDSFRAHHPDVRGATIPSIAPTVRLDYVLVSAAHADAVITCDVAAVGSGLDLAAASDHLPLVADLALPGTSASTAATAGELAIKAAAGLTPAPEPEPVLVPGAC